MTNEQAAELTEPSVGAFDDPTPLVAAQLATIFIAPVPAVLSGGDDQFDAALLQPLAQRVRVVGAVGDHPLRLLPWAAFRSGDTDLSERGFGKRSFTRRGAFQPNSQWKTLAVDQYHPLRSLAALGFTDRSAPFFAGAKLPSRKVSSHFSRPSPSRAPSSARHASSHTSSSSHCLRRRQQVAGDGYLSGRNRHADPVRSTQRIPPNRPGSRPTDDLGYPSAASAPATAARSMSTAHPSTVRIVSCSLQKLTKSTASRISTQLEAVPIYETRSKIVH